jgi:hypothetical protein
VPLGREVDDPAWPPETPGVVDEHTTDLHLAPCARGAVCLVVLGVGAPELERDPLAHDSLGVDRIDEGAVRVRVRMEAELTAAPANEEPEGEQDDDETDRALGRVLNPLRKKAVVGTIGSPKANSVAACPAPQAKPELPGTPRRVLASARNQRGHGSEVIRVGRVAQSEQNGDHENDPDRGASRQRGDSLVEAEYRITFARPNPRTAR